MKKFLMILAALVVTFTAASAQEAGRWALGPRMNIYTNSGDGAVAGLGIFARYGITDRWRIEPAATILFHSHSSVDIQCDAHYLFNVARKWRLYPLAGLAVSDMGDFAFGLNVGGGVDFAVARDWDLTAAVKWMPLFDSSRKNLIAISLGACYKF